MVVLIVIFFFFFDLILLAESSEHLDAVVWALMSLLGQDVKGHLMSLC